MKIHNDYGRTVVKINCELWNVRRLLGSREVHGKTSTKFHDSLKAEHIKTARVNALQTSDSNQSL